MLLHESSSEEKKERLLLAAREALASEEYYRARMLTRQVLEMEPGDEMAEKLMAQILDEEIARQKEAFENKAPEELIPEERAQQVKTWVERAEAFYAHNQYEQALLAAEKVFLYDSDNQQASRLIDQIRQAALRDGKGEVLILKQMAQDEIRDRVGRYRTQAKAWMQAGQWGAARLAVEKILLLSPQDPEALKLYEQIKAHRKLNQRETGKAL